MVQRSYLYATEEDPREGPTGVFGISEARATTPLMQLLLASENAEIVRSQLFPGGRAIIGAFEGGVRRARAVLAAIAPLDQRAAIALEEMNAHFETVGDAHSFLLEPGDVLGDPGEVDDVLEELEILRLQVDAGLDASTLAARFAEGDQGSYSPALYYGLGEADLTSDDIDESVEYGPVVLTTALRVITPEGDTVLMKEGTAVPTFRSLVLPATDDLRFVVGAETLLVPHQFPVRGELTIGAAVELDGTTDLFVNFTTFRGLQVATGRRRVF